MKLNNISGVVRQRLKELIEKNCKVWGASMQTSLPPEFIITPHAEQKLKLRFKCNQEKLLKITVKAWGNKESVEEEYVEKKKKKHGHLRVYRTFYGYIFVFETKWHTKLGCTQKYLITVYKKNGFQLNT